MKQIFKKIIKFTLMMIAMLSIISNGVINVFAENTEKDVVRLAVFSTSGHIFTYLAEDLGYLDEEGIQVEFNYINSGTDAFAALDAGQVDLASSYGTSGPLLQIANGRDFQIFAGYMIQGATPVFGLPDTKFETLEDFKGKSLGVLRGGNPEVVMRGIFSDAGLDPEKDGIEIVEFGSHPDILQAVRKGDVDFGIVGTGLQVQIEKSGMEVKMWPEDYWPNYSCCRTVTSTKWLEENPDIAKRLLRAYLKAEHELESEQDRVVQLVMENLDMDQETAESFILNDKYKLDLDPFRSSIKNMWNVMEKVGYIEDSDVNIDDHINTEIYKSALESLIEEFPEDEFYQQKLTNFNENN